MANSINIVKLRKKADENLINNSYDNVVNSFNSKKYDKYKLNNDNDYIYRKFPEGKLTSKKLFLFIYECLSAWDKFCYLAALTTIAVLTLCTIMITHIIVFPTLVYSDRNLLISAATILLCIYIGKIIFETIFSKLIKRACIKAESCVQYATIQRIMTLSSKSLNNFYTDDLAQFVFIAGNTAKQFLSAILWSISICVIIFALLIQMLCYAPSLFTPTFVTLLIFLFATISYLRMRKKNNNKELYYEITSTSLAYSIVRGIRKIRLYNAERRAFSWWADAFAKKISASNKTPTYVKYYKEIVRLIELLGILVIYYCAATNLINPGSFYVFLAVYSIIVMSINNLSNNLLIFSKVATNYNSLENFRYAETEDYKNKEKIDNLSGAIQLTKLKFKYEPDLPMILDEISLKIEPGQFIAVVGKTGCGKSTLARLLMGFEKPTSGTIFYDRKDLRTLDLRSVRSKIGIVSQEGKLINGSIEENILISNPTLSISDVYKAAEIAGIAEDIKKMPMGYQTIISDESGVISGGQKQRILIARAVVNSPSILILDEATSALDNNTQKIVTNALNKIDVTKIVIAHRLSTIKCADRIILLDNGKIIEDGTYENLIKRNGKFFELIKNQRI